MNIEKLIESRGLRSDRDILEALGRNVPDDVRSMTFEILPVYSPDFAGRVTISQAVRVASRERRQRQINVPGGGDLPGIVVARYKHRRRVHYYDLLTEETRVE